jgi:hypothetical protein
MPVPLSKEAACPRAILCDYQPKIDNQEAHVCVCSSCGRKLIFHKDKKTGRIDSRRYYESHFREFLQPYGWQKDLFVRVYGTANPEAMRKQLDMKRAAQNEDIRREAARFHAALKRNRVYF